jgi:hypothetical protein
MPEVSTLDAVLEATTVAQESPEQDEEQEAEEQEEEQDEVPEEKDDPQLNTLLRKCEHAFTKGNKGLLLSRVECGRWCHAVYVLRAGQNHKDRSFTSTLIFNRLAVHADNPTECNANDLARMYKLVELLCTPERWKAMSKLATHPLSIGKLKDMLPLVARTEGTEDYAIFNVERTEDVKALFTWACGDGISKPSREDIRNRVIELTDPKKYAEKQQKAAEKAAQTGADKDTDKAANDDAEPEAPENLIPTETQTRPAPNWKDVPDGMVALYQEGCKQQPGHSSDMMRDFAKQFVWTAAMVKGLVAGIGDSKDGQAAEEALQAMVDEIAEEYSIFPAAELAAEKAA